ncbi:phosphoglycerate dehydrogenase [Bilifractor porci]|jgi:D-3-phosphoglycerate dehydrogenase|uniref:D-3-phosphoglycerate dehydrogenase n=1 Tax=Bilifractor porci TaxID=2606636 RepID=A0A7X2TNL4_9FIRM|nr:phosphoglycerate dehydrogenase [Bilifractor porci]MST81083.1 phosphoglycerate dehydrogenase [Bilifractor porci]
MFQYHCLNPIASVGLDGFGDNYRQTDDFKEADAVLVRSAKMLDMELPGKLLAVGRAGAGVNNIPLDRCADQGIVVFNTPGANSNGVKELVLAGMLLASRDIVGGIEWVNSQKDNPDVGKLAEKQKKQFAGSEISGKKLGIIGLGAIGQKVANAATHLGMDVYGYDPFISVDAAWNLSRTIHHIQDVNDIYRNCDFITIHVPLTDGTRGMISREAIQMMKDGVVVLNYARDVLVDEEAMVEALNAGKVKRYMTDFANPTVAGVKNVIITPHLGASTRESEDNCAVAAVKELKNFLENGNIKNSVNYPACDMGVCTSASRITICHKNVPDMIRQFTRILSDAGVNITDLTNKSRGSYAYTMIDMETRASEQIITKIASVEGVLRARIVK